MWDLTFFPIFLYLQKGGTDQVSFSGFTAPQLLLLSLQSGLKWFAFFLLFFQLDSLCPFLLWPGAALLDLDSVSMGSPWWGLFNRRDCRYLMLKTLSDLSSDPFAFLELKSHEPLLVSDAAPRCFQHLLEKFQTSDPGTPPAVLSLLLHSCYSHVGLCSLPTEADSEGRGHLAHRVFAALHTGFGYAAPLGLSVSRWTRWGSEATLLPVFSFAYRPRLPCWKQGLRNLVWIFSR